MKGFTIPSSDAAGNQWLCSLILKKMGIDRITLDIDADVISCHKEEAGRTYKKVKGLQSLFGYVSEFGLCLHYDFRAGNIPAGAAAVEFIKSCQSRLTGGHKS